MKTELVTVRRIRMDLGEVRKAIKYWLEAYHEPSITFPENYNITILGTDGAIVEISYEAPEQPDVDPTEALDPAKMMDDLKKDWSPDQLEKGE